MSSQLRWCLRPSLSPLSAREVLMLGARDLRHQQPGPGQAAETWRHLSPLRELQRTCGWACPAPPPPGTGPWGRSLGGSHAGPTGIRLRLSVSPHPPVGRLGLGSAAARRLPPAPKEDRRPTSPPGCAARISALLVTGGVTWDPSLSDPVTLCLRRGGENDAAERVVVRTSVRSQVRGQGRSTGLREGDLPAHGRSPGLEPRSSLLVPAENRPAMAEDLAATLGCEAAAGRAESGDSRSCHLGIPGGLHLLSFCLQLRS
ncbi:uncharacterized protein LOC131813248 [Mustela lutreola]|uniref:uncharacterized protein LOC131813248 n=1 Tax=Mustela lutreola TaxID=9666 RepID=UPI0027971388|nr:uncharacterized protein LOC131813248 [Mustela lutreola]